MFFKSILFIFLAFFVSISLYGLETQEINLKPEFRLSADFWSNPFYYEFKNKYYGTSFNGVITGGVRLKNFTAGAELYEHYYSFNSLNDPDNFNGAFNILRSDAVFFYQPLNWFEFKTGLGGAWLRSAYTNDDTGTEGMNRGGPSIILCLNFIPTRYFNIIVNNTFDIFINQKVIEPYYYGSLRFNFHPYYEWLNLYIEIAGLTWINNSDYFEIKTGLLLWSIGASIDITPAKFVDRQIKKEKIKLYKAQKTETSDKNEITNNDNIPKKNTEELLLAKQGDIVVFNNIIFFPDSKEIKEESFKVLDEIAKILNGRKDINIEIRGHTNDVNDYKAEFILSKKRSETVKKYLMTKGIAEDRMTTFGYGSKNTKGLRIEESNRKVEIKIFENKK